MSNFDHLVTQWMSVVTSTDGSARISSHVERHRRLDEPGDAEVPLGQVPAVLRHAAGVEHREPVREVLAGRESLGVDAPFGELLAVAVEEAHRRNSVGSARS